MHNVRNRFRCKVSLPEVPWLSRRPQGCSVRLFPPKSRMRISVYLKGQDHILEPARHECSRETAGLVLCAVLAFRCGQNAIKLNTEDSWQAVKCAVRRRGGSRHYVPVKMPPREVPGCYFQPPQSDAWRRDHRTVTFLPRNFLVNLLNL